MNPRTFRVADRAEADLLEIRDWYENQRLGLGRKFLQDFLKAAEQCAKNPNRNAVIEPKTSARKQRLSRFPYFAFYTMEKSGVVIQAVVYIKRHERVWKARLP